MKVGQRSLLGYLPAQVIKCVLDGKIKEKIEVVVEQSDEEMSSQSPDVDENTNK